MADSLTESEGQQDYEMKSNHLLKGFLQFLNCKNQKWQIENMYISL
ncbi:13784_t:CDS:2 [Cetraspora pellucida]|uniref:13784_t:CDS:1 n=1 Tax=Cetraspora pellucida TaxID=1433469 RepID=A0A9N9EID3_9GLOM|nr:13784_t:CDS:2 [Cetraspora pellucida]